MLLPSKPKMLSCFSIDMIKSKLRAYQSNDISAAKCHNDVIFLIYACIRTIQAIRNAWIIERQKSALIHIESEVLSSTIQKLCACKEKLVVKELW